MPNKWGGQHKQGSRRFLLTLIQGRGEGGGGREEGEEGGSVLEKIC